MKISARSRVLEVTSEEVQKQGVNGFGLNQILRTSGLSKGALYHHFSSKTELISALISDVLDPYLQKVWLRPLKRSKDGATELKRICLNECNKLTAESCSSMRLFLTLLQGFSVLDESNRAEFETMLQKWLHAIERSFKSRDKQAGGDSKAVSWLILGAFQSSMQVIEISNKRLPAKDVVRSLLNALV